MFVSLLRYFLISLHQLRSRFRKNRCVPINISDRRLWAHQGHVVEWSEEDAAV